MLPHEWTLALVRTVIQVTADQAMPFHGQQLGSWHVKVTASNRGRWPGRRR